MGRVIKKEACPQCREIGKDRSGDNLARYEDYSAFCFSCGYTEKARRSLRAPSPSKTPSNTIVDTLPLEAHMFLDRYNLSESEKKFFGWSVNNQRMAFKGNGFVELRDVTGQKQSKTLFFGDKHPYLFKCAESTKPNLIVVEDIISAIKVARVCDSLCLFGSFWPDSSLLETFRAGYSRVVLWMDYDKRVEALKQARKASTIGMLPKTIFTFEDPKFYSTEEIKAHINSRDILINT